MKIKTPFLRAVLAALTVCVTGLASAADTTPAAQTLYPAGSQQSFKGPDAYFTGEVQVDMLFPGFATLKTGNRPEIASIRSPTNCSLTQPSP